MLKPFCLLLVLFGILIPGRAQSPSSPPAAPPVIRYHFGDNAAWASPDFNDNAWPMAQHGKWPVPAYYSSGFMWVRFQVRVRRDTADPLALRIENSHTAHAAEEVFVNGTRVGADGRFPPRPRVHSASRDVVFNIPAGLASPGTVASIALRLWYPPFVRGTGTLYTVTCSFDQRRTLHAEQATVRAQALLRNLPGMILNGIILLIGCLVLFLARSSRSRNLSLYGAMLASIPLITLFHEIVRAGLVSLSTQQYPPLQALTQLPGMIVTVAFIWRVNDFHDVWVKRVALAAIGLVNIGIIVGYVPYDPSAMSTMTRVVSAVALQIFNVIVIGANLWVLCALGRNRLVAFAMTLPALGSLIANFPGIFHAGQNVFNLALSLTGLFLSFALALNAWKEWRAREALRTEFEAAREVQQHLVPLHLPSISGCQMSAAYLPAAEVGGDFYQVIPLPDASTLLIVGDVSGKGLKAAMTGTLAIGALRTIATDHHSPAALLQKLNQQAVRGQQGGFITCLCAHITPNGTMTVANAGHLSPYRNGDEIPLESGLPLGITEAAEYTEKSVQLNPGDQLTFMSDGVIEARNPEGELYGFDRTRSISTQSAQQIAETAQQFGQEDDITVLTLRYASA